jgi:hypothetical protein
MEKIAAFAVVILLGLAIHAQAAQLAEKQWSGPFPDHTAIPEKFEATIRARFDASENMRPPEVPMPVDTPGLKMVPGPAEAKE